MTKKIFIFSTDKVNLLTVQDYDVSFENNLKSENVPYKVLDIDESHQYYYGDYNTGSLRSINDNPLIEETVIDTITNKEILARYPVHTQLNIIAECIEKSGIPLTQDFVEMRSWINQKVSNHKEAISTYSANTNIYSWVPKPKLDTE